MRAFLRCRLAACIRNRPPAAWAFGVLFLASCVAIPAIVSEAQQKQKLPKPRQLDKEITWTRNPASGELEQKGGEPADSSSAPLPHAPAIVAKVRLVFLTCSVFGSDGLALSGLADRNFRVYDDGVERPLVFFSPPAKNPASVALVIDASPSVLRDAKEMKDSARSLMDALSREDQVAVVDFSAHTYLQLGFSSDRDLLSRALARVDVRSLLSDIGGSNIYQAVYLTARELFGRDRRHSRNAIVLFTDGQDSGLGLTLDPASTAPQPGAFADRLTFEDVMRTLAAEDIQTFVISTENRPKIMTAQWLAAHRDTTLATADARKSGIPAYTLYLAEMARRSGGEIYFLHEAQSLADTFRRIAERVGAEYWLGFTPGATPDAAPQPGWHSLRVEMAGHPGATAVHRTAYYVSAAQ
jgi:VWFA-related protein